MTPRLSERYTQALAYAAEVHATQTRKGDAGIPYISHLLGASSLLIEAGGDEEEAIAALLHDAAEDQGGEPRLADIQGKFGPRVAGIVRECSDSLTEDPDAKADWRVRKEAHLRHLRSASASAVKVTAADKLHNARALVNDLKLEGPLYLERFNASGEDIWWYYRQMYATLVALAAPVRLTSALGECLVELENLIPLPKQETLDLGELELPASTSEIPTVSDDVIFSSDWIDSQNEDLSTHDADTQLFDQWRDLPHSNPRDRRYKEWTVAAVDTMLCTGIPMVAELWTQGPHWQVTLKASPSQRFIAAFRSDGTWVESNGRQSNWGSVLEGGPEQVGVFLARDYWQMHANAPDAIHRYARHLPNARTILRSQR